jgi:hypothetical protein
MDVCGVIEYDVFLVPRRVFCARLLLSVARTIVTPCLDVGTITLGVCFSTHKGTFMLLVHCVFSFIHENHPLKQGCCRAE